VAEIHNDQRYQKQQPVDKKAPQAAPSPPTHQTPRVYEIAQLYQVFFEALVVFDAQQRLDGFFSALTRRLSKQHFQLITRYGDNSPFGHGSPHQFYDGPSGARPPRFPNI